jgi:hypothetical protein
LYPMKTMTEAKDMTGVKDMTVTNDMKGVEGTETDTRNKEKQENGVGLKPGRLTS